MQALSLKFKPATLAAALLLGSLNAQAALTSYTNEGVDLVYSSVSDVTWTKDADLLSTWMTSSTDMDGNGTVDIVDAIIAASPTIINTPNSNNPTGIYTISNADFVDDGTTNWFGAMAFVNYLNSINYGGSNQWYLPAVANTVRDYNTTTNGTARGDELVELVYQELGGTAFNPIPETGYFDNERANAYWSSTEYDPNPIGAWVFLTDDNKQTAWEKGQYFNAWAVSPGMVSSIPEADTAAMLLAGLGALGVALRRRQVA